MVNTGTLKKIWVSPSPSIEELYYYYLTSLANIELKNDQSVLVVGEGPLFYRVISGISGFNVIHCPIHADVGRILNEFDIGVLLTTYVDPERVHTLIRVLNDTDHIKDIEFIYKIDQQQCYRILRELDRYPEKTGFIDADFPYGKFEQIFRDSLAIFEQKTQVRDALDFTYYLDKVSHIEGDILELGSYRGHSGYILSRFQEQVCQQQRAALPKKVFLCDTFEGFPEEKLAIDYKWNNTHDVNFEQVRMKFEGLSNVEFVKGDIRRTLVPLVTQRNFSFVYIDLDSFSATGYALQTVHNKVSCGGVIVCQDYGKEHCIGARLAVDNFIRDHHCVSFFSFFSGLKIIVKTMVNS